MPGDPAGPMTEAEIEAMLFDDSHAETSRAWLRWLALSLAMALGLLAISGGAALSLRHVVKRRTRSLAEVNAQLRRDKARLEETGLLLRLERDFAASSLLASTLQGCLKRLVELVLRIPGVDNSAVYLRNERTGIFEMAAHRGLSEGFALRWRSYRDDLPDYANFCRGRNVAYATADVGAEVAEAMRGEGLRCVLIVPVAVGSEVVAALHVGSGRVDAVPADMRTALESLSIRLGGVLVHFQAQERLRESEALFRRVAEGTFDALGLVGEDGRFLFVNDRMCRTFGYGADDLEGRLFTELLSEEDVIRRVASFRDRLEGKPVPEHFEMSLRRKDGAMFPAEVSVKSVRWRGEKAALCAIKDLSDRKRLEAEVLKIDEIEKERIGQDLHDSVGQELVGMACLLKVLEHDLEEARSTHACKAARAHEICMAAHQGLRGFVRGLLPLGASTTLADGLRRLCENIRVRGGMACVFYDEIPSLRISPPRAKHLYYLAMEAAANAIRHGGARNIVITLAQEDRNGVLRGDDDGSGFDLAAVSRGAGLDTMQYRANVLGGGLSVEPRAGGGTTVRCAFPLQGEVMGCAP
jgi:PAS domain S-box-containing protein